MSKKKVIYCICKASEDEIFFHLQECSSQFIPDLNETVDLKEYSKKIHQKSTTFEAWKENRLIGLVAGYFNDVESNRGFITNVSIIKDFQGLGLASILLNMCITHAKIKKVLTIRLEVNKGNNKAIELYKKHGFSVDAINENSWFMELNIIDHSNVKRK